MRLRRHVVSPLVLARCAAALIAAACAGAPHRPRGPAASTPVIERLVLDRGRCFGVCPVYRLTLTRVGAIEVARDGRAERDSITPAAAQGLLAQAVAAGVLTLPPQIAADPALCPVRPTDHATVRLTSATAGGTRTVEHYIGCYAGGGPLTLAPAVARLVELEAALDEVARDSTVRARLRRAAG